MAVYPAGRFHIFHALNYLPDIAHAHRVAGIHRQHQLPVFLWIGDLVVNADGQRLLCPVETPLRLIHIGPRQCRAHILHRKIIRRQAPRIHLHAVSRTLPALHQYAADAGNLAQLLRQQRICHIVHRRHWQAVRAQGQRNNRRVGRVYFGIVGRVGKVGRQYALGGVNRRLHILRGDV